MQIDLGAQRLDGLQVQIHRTRADGAAAGQRHLGLARARHQRAQHVERGPHLADQVIGRKAAGDLRRVQKGLLAVGAVALGHLHAQARQQLAQKAGVGQARHVGQNARPF